MSYRFPRHFTLQEANTLLPAVQEAFARIHYLVRVKTSPEAPGVPAASASNAPNGACGKTNGNGNGHGAKVDPPDSELTFQQRANTVKEMLVSLQKFGIVVQDVMRGLIDFPCLYEGREVFLCYELADGDAIRFYHEIEEGYAGRHPITDDFCTDDQ